MRLNSFDKNILVTGMQRSGTTFISSVLAKSKDLFYIPEPFNPSYGMVGVNRQYSYIDTENIIDENIILLDNLFSYNANFKKNYSRDNYFKKIFKFIFGTKVQLRYLKRKYSSKYIDRILIKDPDAVFMSDYISNNYNTKVLILIRHPAAVFASYKRLGWDVDLFNLKRLIEIHEPHLTEFDSLLNKKNKTLPEKVGLMWVCIYKILNNIIENNENIIIILHESICADPFKEFKKIFNWADCELTDKICFYIEKHTHRINSVQARKNKLHDFSRDSKSLIYYWKNMIRQDEKDILRKITNSVSSIYYDENSWI